MEAAWLPSGERPSFESDPGLIPGHAYNGSMRGIRPRSAALVVVAVAFFTDTILYYLLVPLLPMYARTYSLGPMGVGLLVWSYAISLLIGTVPLGHLADRFGRRHSMLWGLAGLGASTVLFAFAQNYPLLIFARVLQGLSATATWTAGMALIADFFPSEQRGKAMGTVFAFANLGVLLGPPLSGWLTQHFGPRSPFLVAAGLALLDGAARAILLQDVEPVPGVRLGFRDLLKDGTVRVFAGAMAMGAGLWALLESTLPIHFDAVLQLGPAAIGLCFAASALSHMLTSPLMGALSDRVGRRKVLVAGLLMALCLIPLPTLTRNLVLVVAAMVGLGVTASFIMSPASPALADAVERLGSSSFASVFGLLNLAYAIGMLAGPFLGSLAVAAWGIRSALILVGLCFGGYSLVVWRVRA